MNFNTVFIIPTGIGAEIGGHAGDGTPASNLIASVSDKLVTHPNVVNGADINEMSDNTLYVEGSTLDLFLEGQFALTEVRSNTILVAVNEATPAIIDSVNAARVCLGVEAEIIVLDTPLVMTATKSEVGSATGTVSGCKELINQICLREFDALAIATPIIVEREVALDYLKNGGVNPWGGVEARASRMIALDLCKPVAHAPMDREEDSYLKNYKELVDPRMSAELVSVSYIHCVLKGLHKAPRINANTFIAVGDLTNKDIDVMVSPGNCWGRPHEACLRNGIPIIAVLDNVTIMNDEMHPSCIFVRSYMEAVGVIQAMKNGISLESLKRPIEQTIIINNIK